jgi:hypothetical protein
MVVITGVESPDIQGRDAARARISGTGGNWARGGGPEGLDSVR